MGLTKIATLVILVAIFVCGTVAAPVKRGENNNDDCPELSKDALKLIEILSSHGT